MKLVKFNKEKGFVLASDEFAECLVRQPVVSSITSIPKKSIPAAIENDDFPRPIPLSERSRVWIVEELISWLNTRVAMRDAHVNVLNDDEGGK